MPIRPGITSDLTPGPIHNPDFSQADAGRIDFGLSCAYENLYWRK